MDIKIVLLMGATLLLLSTSLIWGLKFVRLKNYLLGLELWVVTVSTSHLLIYLFTEFQPAYNVSFFLDAFSRAFGIPVIATAGLMAATHNYKPSKLVDVLFFVGSFVATWFIYTADALSEALPYFYLVMWTAFSVYLIYFAVRLARVGKNWHSLNVIVAMIFGQAIACIYDFVKIPGDEDHIIFLTLALTTWSYLSVSLYYSYCALKNTQNEWSPRNGTERAPSTA